MSFWAREEVLNLLAEIVGHVARFLIAWGLGVLVIGLALIVARFLSLSTTG